ncbi:uncharacterized protein LOC101857428 [Aplysia californica]|uniref:Uncharacterized protein LOC101857428 n=1 Tax=Aplysia californica TaxID=6500 RepID=A0ABM1VY21_APLCA|nr:uncharacterized protein LOC101857428 [Aplysia californica]
MHKSRLICLLVVCLARSVNGDFTCDNPRTPKAGDPHLPAVLEENDSYQAHVEVNLMDQNRTMEIDEYLDYDDNQGLLVFYENGMSSRVIYNYEVNEVYSIKELSCVVKNLTTYPLNFLFGLQQGSKNKKHIFGSASALRFGPVNHDVYSGTDVIRGIDVNKWSVCTNWTGAVGKIRVDYFFSKPGWKTAVPDGVDQIPVRIEVEGLSGSAPIDASHGPTPTLSPGKTRHFHHIYDFINFQPVVTDDTVFQIPDGVACANRVNTKPLPKFSRYFSYRAEIVHPAAKLVTHYAVWYDEDSKLMREDKRYLSPVPPVYSKNPLTEIHDFETGVRYIQDHLLGNCSAHPLNLQDPDAQVEQARYKLNNSLVVDMRDPASFFHFNDNYVYSGTKRSRGLLCDVFSAIIPNFPVGETIVNATFEYYFLSDDVTDMPTSGFKYSVTNYPVQLIISAPSMFFENIYNFYEFTEEHPPLSVFDISACSAPKSRIDFKVTFPGSLIPTTIEQWHDTVPMQLAQVAQISPIRIGNVRITSDPHNVFMWASLLSTATAAQFELLPNAILERKDDLTFKNIPRPDECAQLCVENTGFLCKSFDLCKQDGFACRLNINHVADGTTMNNSTYCDHFSRTVDQVLPKEPSVGKVYDALKMAIKNSELTFTLMDNTGFETLYSAVDIEITLGHPLKTMMLPSLPTQFSFRMETVIPEQNRVLETYIWYDQGMKLTRFDQRDPLDSSPFQMTHIHDFSKGAEFFINQVTEECYIGPIPTDKEYPDVIQFKFPNGSDTIRMATPLEFFRLDNTYSYVASVRGILCDVFESVRSDFHVRSADNASSEESIFTFYFLADDWDYVTVESNSPVSSTSQPVMLQITDKTTGTYIINNYYDYDDEHHSMKYYDISKCFGPEERKSFEIIFKGQNYHPYLDVTSNTFLNTALLKLGQATSLSPLHFQNLQVTYDDENVYLLVTLLGNIPSSGEYGLEEVNDNDERFKDVCPMHNLVLGGTVFLLNGIHKAT